MSLDLTGWQRPDQGALFVVTGSSGTGKTTLLESLLARLPELSFSVSATTRPARPDERDGVHYHFLSAARFDALEREGAFLEQATVYGNRYGTLHEPVQRFIAGGQSVVLDIDTQGATKVCASWPRMNPEQAGVVSIFVLPPSLQVLEERLRGRRSDPEEVIRRRVAEAHLQLQECGNFDYLLVNDRLQAARDQLQAIVVAELLRRSRRGSWVRRMAGGATSLTPSSAGTPKISGQ